MEQGLGSESIDKSRVWDVKPLRCLAPVFPNNQSGKPSSTIGPFPSGVAPFYPFLVPDESPRTDQHTPNGFPGSSNFGNTIPSPVPLNAFRTPTTQVGSQYVSGFSMHVTDEDASSSGRQKGKLQKRARSAQRAASSSSDFNEELVVNSLATSFKLMELDTFRKANGDKDLVNTMLLVYDLLRRRITQYEETREGIARRPALKAGNLLMSKGIRTNTTKRIGHVPGIDIGDIFFFRMELCLVGLHAPSMAGIDYISVKVSGDEEPVAVSIVSSGGYEDDGDDGDVLIYTGQGGVQRPDGLMFDQKLERGNLALEKSVHRGNEVRVIRGLKDVASSNGKIYVYDGLYKIQESWAEKNKSGLNIFRYKLVRIPGQPEAFTLWKTIQQWKDGVVSSRGGLVLPDLSSGAESLPVSLVNDVDDENVPPYFAYIPTLKYTKPFLMPTPSLSCHCVNGCKPGDANCPCIHRNGGLLPYTSHGVLLSYKSLVHECGRICGCPSNCRNRITQAGLRVRLEVFRTKNRGWGLRSWDPIRAGGFICEYAGEIIDASWSGEFGSENVEDSYIFDAARIYEPLEADAEHEGVNESSKAPFPLVINAKSGGNASRFMNHSCSPNVYWQPVLREESEGEAYLHIAFFAIKHIPPMQELTYDYGIISSDKRDEQRKRKCLCGSSKCRGYFY